MEFQHCSFAEVTEEAFGQRKILHIFLMTCEFSGGGNEGELHMDAIMKMGQPAGAETRPYPANCFLLETTADMPRYGATAFMHMSSFELIRVTNRLCAAAIKGPTHLI